jgi:N-acyl-D-aspartate/D-glutamate deacylase
MRLDAFAAGRHQPVVDAVLDLLAADRGMTQAIYFSMSEDDLEYGLRRPWVGIGTDGGARPTDSTAVERPHPRVYGTFPRVLCRYVRERHVLTVEEAVRRFTTLPAARARLQDRGTLRAGMYADLTLFDPRTVCDRATFQDPVQTPVGIPHVIVNGVPVVRDGRVTGERPGRALRRGH